MDAEEDDVDVDRPQRAHRERPDERIRRRAHAAREDDRLVRAAAVVEGVGRGHGVRHDRQARQVQEAAADLERRRARRDRDGHAGLDEPGGGARDRDLGLVLEGPLRVEAGLMDRGVAQQRGASVDLHEMPARLELLEVAADGHVRDVASSHQSLSTRFPVSAHGFSEGVASVSSLIRSNRVSDRCDMRIRRDGCLAAGVSIFELARLMETSVAMIDERYGHLARGLRGGDPRPPERTGQRRA